MSYNGVKNPAVSLDAIKHLGCIQVKKIDMYEENRGREDGSEVQSFSQGRDLMG